jgi:hypothetical protein
MVSDHPQRRTRRNLLKTTVTIGGLKFGSSSVLAADNKKLIKYVHYIKSEKVGSGKPQRTPIYRTMAKHEWDRRNAATKAAEKVNRKIKNRWGDTLIRPYFTSLNNSPIGFGVQVHYNTYVDSHGNQNSPEPKLKNVKNFLPNEITVNYDGKDFTSSVDVRKSKTEEAADCGESVSDMGAELWEHEIPGGVPCKVKTDDSNNQGTFCATFYETDYSAPGLILSGHVAEDIRNDVEQVSTYVGDIYDYSNTNTGIDWAFARLSDPFNPKYYIAHESNENNNLDYTVDGIVSNAGLRADVDTDEVYYTQGRDSRRQPGTLEEMGVNDQIGLGGRHNDVKSSHDTGFGDSGGPLFKTTSDNTGAYIAGVMYARFTYMPLDDNCGSTLSTTAETVEEDAPGFFH